MAVHAISDEVSRKFTTTSGRREMMQKYQGVYSGTNEEGETIQLSICSQLMELTTFQKNGWVRINWYDAKGQPSGETFDGKW